MVAIQTAIPVQCTYCSFVNVPGVQHCQVCGALLPQFVCPQCHFGNPLGYHFCIRCDATLVAEQPRTRISLQSAPSNKIKPSAPKTETSPVALIGFGAILALASAAFPWYLLGSPGGGDTGPETVGSLLQHGWQLFPGVPLILITLSSVASSLVAVIHRLSGIRSQTTLASGFITLLSAASLWQRYPGSPDSSSVSAVPPDLGAALITIGAIVLVVGGIWILQTAGRGSAPKEASDSTSEVTNENALTVGQEPI